KIMDNFSMDELDEARNVGLEINQHPALQNPNITPDAAAEAWRYKVLNTFFPDVSIPKTMASRAQATIGKRPALQRLQQNLSQPAPRTITKGADLIEALRQMAEKAGD